MRERVIPGREHARQRIELDILGERPVLFCVQRPQAALAQVWFKHTGGTDMAKLTRCNIEGYGGLAPQFKAAIVHMLAQMPGGRCPYPPGDRPGILGFDSRGHYVGTAS